jgi:hypothetical protein
MERVWYPPSSIGFNYEGPFQSQKLKKIKKSIERDYLKSNHASKVEDNKKIKNFNQEPSFSKK